MQPELQFTKKTPKFMCVCCEYKSDSKKDYSVHLLTLKHQKNIKPQVTCSFVNFSKKHSLECVCGKTYKYRQGLYKHKKICKSKLLSDYLEKSKSSEILKTFESLESSNSSQNVVKIAEMFKEQLKENEELKKMFVEQNKKLIELINVNEKGKNIIMNTNNTTNNFNLHIFLNEKCKDALNITDFLDSLKLQLTDLELVGKLGYTEGISKIFIRGLKELDIFKRPIHCSDVKRETMYVKDKDAWEKENEHNEKIKSAINFIANKNVEQIPIWITENPESSDYESKKHDEYIKILGESMSNNDKESQKIIKNISKEMIIEKEK